MGDNQMIHSESRLSQDYVRSLLRANHLRQQQDYQGARGTYVELLKERGDDTLILRMIASCSFSLADFDAAVAWTLRALEVAPDNAGLHLYLAECYGLGTLELEEAVREYQKAIALDPHNTMAYVGAAALYGAPEEVVTLDQAIGWLERATQLDPDDPNWHGRLAQLYGEAGEEQKARAEWARALLCPRPLSAGYAEAAGAAVEPGTTA